MILGALERALASTESSFLTRVKDVSKDQPEYAVGGASLVAAIVTATDVYVINLGDSRAVIVRGEEVGRGWRGVLRKGAGVGGGGSASLVSGRRRSGEGGRGRGGSGGWGSGGRGEGEGSGSSKGSSRREKVGETGDIWEKGEKWERGEISGAVGAMESAGSRGAGGGEAGGGEKGGGRGGGVWRWKAERLTVDHNTSNAAEVRRVQQAHADSDVIRRGRLKGKIKLTRAFGAAYLKDQTINDALLGMFRVKYQASASASEPYLSSLPHLRHVRISPSDRLLILSSDGLYQHMQTKDVSHCLGPTLASFFLQPVAAGSAHGGSHPSALSFLPLGTQRNATSNGTDSSSGNIAEGLVREALERAAEHTGSHPSALSSLPLGTQRRKIHDDISVIVLEIQPPPQQQRIGGEHSTGANRHWSRDVST
ncbi:unnamed protein product [Closterium sp. NIES-64]|nr:unnamed protein product [Closterium sp. NIES-64]